MFQDTDAQLREWLTGLARSVRFGLPADEHSTQPTLWCHLHRIERDSHGGLERRLDLTFRAHYLVVPTAKTAERSHKLLGDLAIAVAEQDGMLIEDDPSSDVWRGRPCPMLPGLALSVNATWQRDPDPVPMVEEVAIERTPLSDFNGTLIGPNKRPMPGEAVYLPQVKAHAVTDADGRFAFRAIPLAPGRAVLVQIRQQRWQITPRKRPTTLTYQSVES